MKMEGKGIHLTCHACKKQWTMDEYGQLAANDGDTDESNGKQVQSNGWRAFPAGGLGAVPGRGPEIPQAA